MPGTTRLETAIQRLDDANHADPTTETHRGREWPRELLFATTVTEWVRRLDATPSEALLLAAHGHTLRRWDIPRNSYAMNRGGYHQWRRALAAYHADQTTAVLRDVGIDDGVTARVEALIRRTLSLKDPEAQTLEDADCLAFLELKFHKYLDAWDDPKMMRILLGTLRKMSPRARELALQLDLSAAERDWLRRAAHELEKGV